MVGWVFKGLRAAAVFAAAVTVSLGGIGTPSVLAQQRSNEGPNNGKDLRAHGSHVYIGPVKGKCPTGTVKAVSPKVQTVKWVKAGKIVSKKVAKGAVICRFVSKSGTVTTGTTDAAGQLTALPSGFPSKPTAADIASLGLTKDSKVSPSLRIPQPTGASYAPAQLAAKVRPVGVTSVYEFTTPAIKDPITGAVFSPAETRRYAVVEWEFTGGSGLVESVAPSNPGVYQYTRLSPSGTTRVLQDVSIDPDYDGSIGGYFHGSIVPDYGQSSLPASTVQDWNLPAAKDKSGVGSPVGITANPSYWDQSAGPRDGYVSLDPDGTIQGNYNF